MHGATIAVPLLPRLTMPVSLVDNCRMSSLFAINDSTLLDIRCLSLMASAQSRCPTQWTAVLSQYADLR